MFNNVAAFLTVGVGSYSCTNHCTNSICAYYCSLHWHGRVNDQLHISCTCPTTVLLLQRVLENILRPDQVHGAKRKGLVVLVLLLRRKFTHILGRGRERAEHRQGYYSQSNCSLFPNTSLIIVLICLCQNISPHNGDTYCCQISHQLKPIVIL